MTSIRRQLTLSLTLVCCVVWAGGAAALYLTLRAGLSAEFDQALEAQAQTLAVLTSQENGALEFDFNAELMPSYARGEKADYFEIRLADGSSWQRSPSLGAAGLPRLVSRSDAPTFSSVTLPDGLAGRAVATRFVVPQTDEEPAIPPGPRVTMALVVARHRVDLDRRLRLLALALGAVGVATAVATAMLVPLLVGRGLLPLSSLAARAAAIDANALDVRFPTGDMPAELLPIGERLNELLARLQSSFERERRFSADVAHELRTPIAELRLLAEVALRWPEDPQASTQALRDALDVALQLELITTGLLALARHEAGLQRVSCQPVSLAEAVQASWRPLADSAREKGLSVAFAVADAAWCDADRSLLGLVLANLLGNAVQHSPREGALLCRGVTSDARCELSISNPAPDLDAEDLPHLFERFWRKDPARTADSHSGLGLALAKALAEAMGMRIRAELRPTGTLVMTVSARPADPRAVPDPKSALASNDHVEAVD